MALKEHYNTDIDSSSVTSSNIYGASIWSAQTFTAADSTARASVKVLLFRTGSPGDITINIEATASGKPNGSVLATGTASGNSITTDYAGEWFEVAFDTPYTVAATTVYAIVVKALSGDASNKIQWRSDESSPTYSDGSRVWTSSGGSSYTIDTTKDMGFELYSGVTYSDISGTLSSTSALSGDLISYTATDMSGTMAGTSALAGDLSAIRSSTGLQGRAGRTQKRLVAINNNCLYYEDLT